MSAPQSFYIVGAIDQDLFVADIVFRGDTFVIRWVSAPGDAIVFGDHAQAVLVYNALRTFGYLLLLKSEAEPEPAEPLEFMEWNGRAYRVERRGLAVYIEGLVIGEWLEKQMNRDGI